METRVNRRRTLEGEVVSDKMNKTRVVQVRSVFKHVKYNKIVRAAKKFKVHDEQNSSKMGDRVLIMETRPISKDKRWVLVEIYK
ncbi:MAG: 30S ribosomal protein S17 [Candidatus Omnitrophota bacterium]